MELHHHRVCCVLSFCKTSYFMWKESHGTPFLKVVIWFIGTELLKACRKFKEALSAASSWKKLLFFTKTISLNSVPSVGHYSKIDELLGWVNKYCLIKLQKQASSFLWNIIVANPQIILHSHTAWICNT